MSVQRKRKCWLFKINVFKNFANFPKKHLLESFFDEVAGLKAASLLKETSTQILSCEIFKNTFFYGTPLVDTSSTLCFASGFLNTFVPNAPFPYSLKTSENLSVFWCFQRVGERCIGNEWVKILIFGAF